jgi:O-antigen/teichoic acid export membrane protein
MGKPITWIAQSALWHRTRSGLLTEFVVFAISTALLQVSRFGVHVVAARWLGPATYGIWNGFTLALTYAPVLTLGTINAMNRGVPLLIGRGDQRTAQRAMQVTLTVSLVTGVLTGLVTIVLGLTRWNSLIGRAAAFLGFLLMAQQVYIYLQTWLKCSIRFSAMSCQQAIYALVYPLVVLPTTALWGLSGFVLGQALVVTGVSVWIIFAMRAPFSVGFDRVVFHDLVKVGLPIMAAGTLYGLLTTIDRWVILTYLGIESLGYYSLAIMASSMLGLLPIVVAQQMYPRMAHRYGETGSARALRPMVIRQMLLSSGVTIPILGIVYVGLPWIVKFFLTAYAPGIGSARILLLGLACLPLSGGIGNFLNTVGKQNYYLLVQAIGVVFNFILEVIFVKAGMGLRGVALGAALAMALYTLSLWGVGLGISRTYGSPPISDL